MERADHRPALTHVGRRGPIVVVAALAMLIAGCTGDERSSEPGVQDTATGQGTDGDGSILQATIADDAAADDAGGDRTTDGETTEDGKTDGGDGDETDDPSAGTTTTTSSASRGFCAPSQPTEIQFDRGTSSATIDIAASGGQRDLYTLEVNAGQIMTVRVESADATATASLRAPTTDLPSTDFTERTIIPTRAGVYEVCVTAGSTGTDAQLFVSVIDDNSPVRVDEPWCGSKVNDRGEIRFDTGTFGTTIEGGVLRDEHDVFTFEAGAGQFIELFLTSLEDNAVFDLRTPSGEMLIADVSDFRIPLPEDGDYLICVGSARGNASYVLNVSIA